MRQRVLGQLSVGEVGFGCAAISVRDMPDEAGGARALRAALDAGVTLFDTADVYNPPGRGAGHSELLLRQVLSLRGAVREGVVIATKGGKYWTSDHEVRVNGSPRALRRACKASLRRLGLDALPLYFLHEPDPTVPFADSVGALAELRAEGLICHVGVSNVDLAQLEQARSIVEVAAVENEYSLTQRLSDPVVERCAQLGIAFLPWGSLKGIRDPASMGAAVRVRTVASRRGVTPEQVVIAWLLARSPTIIPIPGSRRPETILDSVAGATLELDGDERRILDTTTVSDEFE
jgi:aryl-alcohol dehydrogenase-like predicted oxidoreductase